MKVLVVDDEAFLAELVKLALEADGHACFTARSISEAAEILRAVRVDLLTLDLTMNGSNPLGWLEEVLQAHPDLLGRVFILTGRLLEPDEIARAKTCGARVIQKPFTLHQLREIVRMITPAPRRAPDPHGPEPGVEP